MTLEHELRYHDRPTIEDEHRPAAKMVRNQHNMTASQNTLSLRRTLEKKEANYHALTRYGTRKEEGTLFL